MKKQNKFREWLADKVLDLYFWLAEMTEQEYWERANMFRPTPRAADGAYCTCENSNFFVSDFGLTCWSCKKPRR